jgi:hypothetical protein
MKGVLRFSAVLLLAGCTTYSERQAESPWHVVNSDKSLRDYEGCVAPRMRDIAPQVAAAADGETTVLAVTIPNSRNIPGALTLVPVGAGTRAELRSETRRGYFGKFAAIMDACR